MISRECRALWPTVEGDYTLRVVGNGIKAQSGKPRGQGEGRRPCDKSNHRQTQTHQSVSVTAAGAVSGLFHCRSSSSSSSRFANLFLWFPEWRTEGQVISLELELAPPPTNSHHLWGVRTHQSVS
ncbi:unnamed protein product [Pleuronectes platessa]|uniref:Uncharacterized protein n=1 Tax=Pleuronectes platessa TaxID=8262 RepID=A0A9N7YSH8_PLEPL|nr:unnamed protein product [Pleuronectes platessa]